jgi:hypothetical protein
MTKWIEVSPVDWRRLRCAKGIILIGILERIFYFILIAGKRILKLYYVRNNKNNDETDA